MTIPIAFLRYASDIIADTDKGVSGAEVIKVTSAYAAELGLELPHPASAASAQNKRTALLENLRAFEPETQFLILMDLLENSRLTHPKARELKVQLISQYGKLDTRDLASNVNDALIEETRHWLEGFPKARELYEQALEKYSHGIYDRNMLDDLRASLEQLLMELLGNSKSLENQLPSIGLFLKNKGGSPEVTNMLHKLLELYSKYQNEYIKHDNEVNAMEKELMIELTSSFMKHLVRISLEPL